MKKTMVLALLFTHALVWTGCGYLGLGPFGSGSTVELTFPTQDVMTENFEFTSPEKWQFNPEGVQSGAIEFTGPGDYKPPVRSPLTIGLIADRQFDNFTLDVDLKQTGREYGHRDMCIIFGFQDPSHYYYAHVATATDPHAHNIFIVDGKDRVKISTFTTEGVDWGTDWKHVRLVRDTNTGSIRLYFTDATADGIPSDEALGEPIMTATDTTFGPGYIGFGSFDDSGMIDNIRIQTNQLVKEPSDFFPRK